MMKKKITLLSLSLLFSFPLFAQDLFTAIQSKDVPAVKFLLNKGTDANAKDAQGATPLITAAAMGQERIVLLLLQRNVDVDAQDKAGNTALILASALTGQEDMMNLLVHHYPKLDAKNNEGTTALIAAVKARNAATAAYLLKYGADAKLKDKQHKAALDYAKEQNNATLVALLDNSTSTGNTAGK
jgi:ankyrin repeat protein